MDAGFFANAAANTVGNLTTEYTSRYVSYFFHFGRIVEEFKNQRGELELKKDRVKNDVNEAIRQTEVIEKDVEEWLTRAERELGEAQSLEDEIERNKCFNWCPSWGWRYCLSKKAARKTLYISKLLETCNFPRVGQRAPLQGIEFLLPKDFMHSESSKSTFNGIMKALSSYGVNMIGLYGMPGVGKTTLAEVVGKQAREQKLFDKVVIVTVSQTPNINKIQDKIAEILGLKYETNTEEGKAEELWRRLKDQKKMLIIVDDVWKEFKLQTIGIPFGGEHKGCKILLTTRLQQVCVQMNCQEKFELKILFEDEAWALFKDNADLKDVSPTLNDVAKQVARECKGLPLAIVTMAKALKGESLDGWIAANERLKSSRHLDNQDICGSIYNCLKLSYDYLKEDNIQSCFLLCSLFPEDYEINIELLTICGIGRGLFCHINLIEDLRREIRLALSKLKMSGLLLEIDDEGFVKMHDVVRDFAHWITSRGENIFMVKDGLTEWSMSESLRCYMAISLWNSKINNLPEKLEFSKLKILFLTGKNSLRVSSMFFEGMKSLQVLFLGNVVFSLEALQFLTNLRTLCFVDCELQNISSLRNMKNLEVFALLNTNIHELPGELVELHRLKSLYFSCYGNSNVPPNLLSRLASLQELHVTSKNNVNLSDLNSFSRLTALTLRVNKDHFQENFVFPKLQRYNIAFSDKDLEYLNGLSLRTLRISDFSSSLNAFKELFCNVEKLTLYNIMEHKNIIPRVDQWGLNELTSLELRYCKDVECLIDTTREQRPTAAFSNLVKLDMSQMTCLKELCHGHSPIKFLQKLETLIIWNCEQLQSVFQMNGFLEEEARQTQPLSNLTSLSLMSLPALQTIWKEPTHHASLQSLRKLVVLDCRELKYIFSSYLAQSLLHLEQLVISVCKNLEQVFTFAREMPELEVAPLSNLTCLELELLPELSYIWRGPTHLVNLQNLKTMKILQCFKLAYLFSPALIPTLVHLEELHIYDCDSLKHIIAEVENGDEIVSNINHYPLEIASYESSCLFSLSPVLQNLREVRVINCGQLQGVFQIDKLLHDSKENQGPLLSNLTLMKLVSLPELKWIWKQSTHFVNLRSLKFVEISYCNRLRYLFSPSLAQSLELLEQLKVDHCDELQHLITKLERDDEMESDVPLHSPLLPKLETLTIYHCPRLEYVFEIHLANVLPRLKSFWIFDSPQLQQVFNVVKEKNGVDCAIALPCLQDLRLVNLINLSWFHSKNFLMALPFLEKLEVCNCPRFTNLTIQKNVNEQVQLKELYLSNLGNSSQLCNTVVPLLNQDYIVVGNHEEVFQVHGRYSFSSLNVLRLKHLSEMRNIWKDVTQNVIFENLTILEVTDCRRLSYIFSPTTISRSLSQLVHLDIRKCEELDQIIAKDQVCSSSNGDSQPICFPNLITISVKYCKKLKSLFPLGFARCIPKLEYLVVEGNSKLEQVFEVEDEAEATTEKEIEFDQLKILSLEELPCLIDFCPRGYHFVLSTLSYLIVKNCPKMTTGFFIDSESFVQAKEQTPRLVKQDAPEGSATAQNAIRTRTIDWQPWMKCVLPPYMEEL